MDNKYVVTARKWRPKTFSEVVGQQHIAQTLKNSIANDKVHHAYLFTGPRGVGKTTTARIFARAMNCLKLQKDIGEPCNECENCTSVLQGNSIDIIEIDGASHNSVDNIRNLRENAKYPPSSGKYKMYIIDEIHMLSNSAFNALLKTLEEPPRHLMFVFATTEPHKIPQTIISRTQRFDFRRMSLTDISTQLKMIAKSENIEIDDRSILAIAKKGDGSMRDSQSIFDQVLAFSGAKVTYELVADCLNIIDDDLYFELTNCVISKKKSEIIGIFDKIESRGYDFADVTGGYIEHIRNLHLFKLTESSSLLSTTEEYYAKYEECASNLDQELLLRYLDLLIKTEQELRFSSSQRIRLEHTLMVMCSIASASDLNSLIEAINNSNIVTDSSKEVKKKI